jgi:hypothetical protein
MFCRWGRQSCGPDGHWGACVESATAPRNCATTDMGYNEACCIAAGECCQHNEPNAGDKPYSTGTCAPLKVTCTSN